MLLESYKKKNTLNLSPGKQEIDLVNVLDISKLINKIIIDIRKKKLKGFKKYTVSSKKPIKIIKLVEILKQNLKFKLNVNVGVLKYRKNESMKCLRKTFNYPKWNPKNSLSKDLKKIFDGN